MSVEIFQNWVRESREQQSRAPERYLAHYPELVMADHNGQKYVLMTQETLDRIERYCGRYDGTFPTGAYLGKMFLRGDCLFWIGINKKQPFRHITWNSRRIVVLPS